IAPRLGDIYDEPFSDPSAVPTFLLCKAAREHVKVALSADGGDEFFCGYTHYTMFTPVWGRISALPLPLREVMSSLLMRRGSGPGKAMEPLLVRATNRFFPDLEAADFSDKLIKLSRVMAAPGIHAAYASAISIWPEELFNRLAPALQPSDSLSVF